MEPSGFREIVRSATVSHPVPYTFALCLAFSVTLLAGAAFTGSSFRWVLVGFAAAATLYGFAIHTFAVLRRPELLRSERYQTVQRVIDFIEDSDFDPTSIEAGRFLLDNARMTRKTSGSANQQPDGRSHS